MSMSIRDPRPYMRPYIGQPYAYGFRGWAVNKSNVETKRRQYKGNDGIIPCEGPIDGSMIGLDCIGAICAACSVEKPGDIMGYTKTGMGYYQAKNGKKGNAFMDAVSANGAKVAWGAKPIVGKNVPEPTAEKPGVVVFIYEPGKAVGHIGMYMGDGVTCEATPPRVQETKLYARKTSKGSVKQWTHWAYIPDSWLTWACDYWGQPGTNTKPTAPDKSAHAPSDAQNTPTLADLRVKPGDRVRIKPGSTNYWPGGPKMPTAVWFWKNPVFTIEKITFDGKNPRYFGGAPCVLLGDGNNTWCDIANLEKA